jgi:hypothetical protein
VRLEKVPLWGALRAKAPVLLTAFQVPLLNPVLTVTLVPAKGARAEQPLTVTTFPEILVLQPTGLRFARRSRRADAAKETAGIAMTASAGARSREIT